MSVVFPIKPKAILEKKAFTMLFLRGNYAYPPKSALSAFQFLISKTRTQMTRMMRMAADNALNFIFIDPRLSA